MTGLALVLPGMLLALGAVLIVAAFRPRHARLGDALGVLADASPPPDPDAPPHEGAERLGAWLLARRPVVAPASLRRRRELRGRSLTRHYGVKARGALLGLTAPLLLGLVLWGVAGVVPAIPVVAALGLAAVGYVVPDVLLRGAGAELAEDATEALLTYFDLVTLERLANQSATQSLRAAASVSDVAIFTTIRGALERARLEQRMPYAELRGVGRELALPALVDLADVMRLDEAGASLSGTLRARVRELRDAHLTRMKMTASEVSERMTLFMVIPSLVFGLIFLVPRLLTLVSSG